MANEVYELDAGDYKPVEVEWIKNDQRGNLNVDWEKWFNNEKDLLDVKVRKQLRGFQKNLMDNILNIRGLDKGRNPLRISFIRDFDELSKQLSEAINNAKLGPASKKTLISVAENLRTNEIDSIKQALTIQGFNENLFPDGNVSVAYYDESSNFAPKDSWSVENRNRASFITHNETGLTFKLDSKGLSFIDNNNFKINNKIIDYGEINTPRNVNLYPTGDEFDPMGGYDGPPYDAQTMDADLRNIQDIDYDEYYDPGPRPTPGNIVMGPDGPYEETVQDAADWDYEQEELQAEADAEDRRLNMQAEEERLRAQGYLEYGNPLDDFDGPPYDAQTMDADRPYSGDMADVKENLVNEIDKQSGQPGMGMKALDLVGKIAGPIDETLLVTLRTGIPKLLGGTALAGAAAAGGSFIATALMYLSAANLAAAVIRGAGTFAYQYGGDTSKAMDAILAGEIPEKTFVEAVKESSKEGFTEFGKQMEYDPFYFIVDKTILQPIFGKDQGVIVEKGMEGIQYLLGGQKQGSYEPPYGSYTKKYGQYGVDY